ncbi:MAG TPA: FemAB family XrtA/PEP-CTERM system-associated protein [Longimicrobiaceae bacterium]|nr:FemAB family XrtA/PEP-CTERM system-associated protein [Longimicrobiaceae bacterium]
MHGALTAPAGAPPEVREVAAEGPEWDAFVAAAEGSTFCHLAGWREVMGDVMGHECRYLAAVEADGRWVGVLPLVRVRSRVLGHYLLSMPFLNDGGPLGAPAVRRLLGARAVEEAQRMGVDLLELRTREPVGGALAESRRKVTVLLPLPDTPGELWEKGFRAKLRSQVRRPMKEGLTTRFGAEEVGPFYEVFARNMRDLGTPVLPRAWFERIARVFPEQALFGTVYSGATPVAAGCGFAWGGEFEITWASSLREFNSVSPNMLLYWAFMERVIGQGVRVFNFGRCTPGAGTHRFKLQWGGQDVPLPWAQWSAGGVAATPSPDRPVFRLATAAWQRLPVPVANLVGPALARRLP